MLDKLSIEQISGIMDALPIEVMFADADDRIRFRNKKDTRLMQYSDDILGQDIRSCHQPESLPRVEQMLTNLKIGAKDEEEFWVTLLGDRVLNRFIAIRNKSGKYLGVLEYLMNFDAIEQIAEAKKDAYRR
ncbi:MAG: PAS domain-containing protein [Deltaproteobacteria bacterium]|nr:PAS domain-containing protein [Deltaproteobacteria bacterium]